MKQKLLEALKAKFPGDNAAVPGRIADKFAKTATTEEQLTTAVAGLTQESIEVYGKSDDVDKTMQEIAEENQLDSFELTQ